MPSANTPLADLLRAIVGPQYVLTAPEELAPMLVDNRGRWHGKAHCCVLPGSTEETCKVMRLLAEHHALVFPQAGNTGNAAAATPVVAQSQVQRSVLVNLRRMNRIEEIDAVNNTARVEAGVILENLQQEAAKYNRIFPLSLAAQGSCQIGGNIATNAGGVHVLHYGNTRDLVLGLEVVLPNGELLPMLRGLRKDNAGYDLKQIFIGSEGTLGLITRAIVKLFPRPNSRTVAVAALDRLENVEQLFEEVEGALGPSLTAFELMHRDTIAMVRRMMPQIPIGFSLDHSWYVLLEEGHWGTSQQSDALEEILGHELEHELITDAVLSQSEAQAQALWAVRESIPSAHKKAGGNVKHDISVPRSCLVAFIQSTVKELKAVFPWIAPSIFGHFGDGNLHFNMGAAAGENATLPFQYENAIHDIVYAAVTHFHGSIAAEHGVGRLKCGLLPTVRSASEMEAMRLLKRSFDPDNRMNPGAVISAL